MSDDMRVTCQSLVTACGSAEREIATLQVANVPGWHGEAAEREANIRAELLSESEQLRNALNAAAHQAKELEQLLYWVQRVSDPFGIH